MPWLFRKSGIGPLVGTRTWGGLVGIYDYPPLIDGGTVRLGGQDVTNWPMYKRARFGMGYLPQDNSIFRKLTVEQNVSAILEYLNVSRKERKLQIDRLLGQFGLDNKRRQIASTVGPKAQGSWARVPMAEWLRQKG